MDRVESFIFGGGTIGAVIGIVPLFLRPQNSTWIYGLVLVFLGMSSGYYWPIAISLLVQWFQPDVKE